MKKASYKGRLFCCDRDRIQTCNRLIRSQLLYSVELRGLLFSFDGCKGRCFLVNMQIFEEVFSLFYSIKRELNICQPNVKPKLQLFFGEL